jgi:hypothetical protein
VANYLLGNEALYSYLVARDPENTKGKVVKIREWAKARTAQDYLYASRISVAMLAASIERIPVILKRDTAREALNSTLISAFKDSLLEVDEGVLRHWSILRAGADDEAEDKLSSEQLIEVATALHTGYTYVARLTAPLKAIQQNVSGLVIDDPWS